MIVLSDSVAFAQPSDPTDLAAAVKGIGEGRDGLRAIEVRIGVGPLDCELPARVLGYAECVAETLRVDASRLVGKVDQIIVFSSAPKAGQRDAISALRPLSALGGALRVAGVAAPIVLDTADPEDEIRPQLRIALDEQLRSWVSTAAAQHNGSEGYAFEHAAASMFADLAPDADGVFRLTIGGRTEAPFWAVRMRVRAAALAHGELVTPAAGLILKAVRRPWYYPMNVEPPLSAMIDPATAAAALDLAANPEAGGNQGLTRESRALRRFIKHAGCKELVDNLLLDDPIQVVRMYDLEVGPRLSKALKGDLS